MPRSRIDLKGMISIHAPNEGCDLIAAGQADDGGEISIHAPNEGCDLFRKTGKMGGDEFQSTHPTRGATVPSRILRRAP